MLFWVISFFLNLNFFVLKRGWWGLGSCFEEFEYKDEKWFFENKNVKLKYNIKGREMLGVFGLVSFGCGFSDCISRFNGGLFIN